jgi:transposase
MIIYRYMPWNCKHVRLSLRRFVEELEGIRIALVQEKLSGKVEVMVEEMDAKKVRLFT